MYGVCLAILVSADLAFLRLRSPGSQSAQAVSAKADAFPATSVNEQAEADSGNQVPVSAQIEPDWLVVPDLLTARYANQAVHARTVTQTGLTTTNGSSNGHSASALAATAQEQLKTIISVQQSQINQATQSSGNQTRPKVRDNRCVCLNTTEVGLCHCLC